MEELKVEERGKMTASQINRLRKGGFIPGIIYGQNKPNILIYLSKRDFTSFLSKKTHVLSLKIGENVENVIIKEKQRDPLRGEIIHLDFMRISLKEKIEIKIGIRPIGIAAGVVEGGFLEQHIYELNIKCPATNIPEAIDVSVRGLKIGDLLYVKDIVVPPEIEILDEGDKIVFSVIPRKEEALEIKPPEIEEPEVIKKREKEEELE